MLHIKHLSKTFNKNTPLEVQAIKSVSLELKKGEFAMVIGSNGSGKSTLLNCVAGSILPDSGSIELNGRDLTFVPDYQRSKSVARIFQNPLAGTAPDLSLLENFRLASLRTQAKTLKTMPTKAFAEQIAERVKTLGMGLENKLHQPMGSFSGGQRQALSLLMATQDKLDLLLLDEPTAALDPASSEVIVRLIDEVVSTLHLTALMVSHDMHQVTRLGTRVIQMAQGEIRRNQSTETQKPDYDELVSWFR
jgi:putative ABC transport system ATP-binding protein